MQYKTGGAAKRFVLHKTRITRVLNVSTIDVVSLIIRFIGRQRDGNGKKTLRDMCL